MKRPTVFLSYAREDVAEVQDLYDELTHSGLQPWMDTRDIVPGQDWELAVAKAIRQADFFIACLSTQSVNKRGYLQRELRGALDVWKEKLHNDVYLIPARLDNCEVPETLGKFQWVDLFEQEGLGRLLGAILGEAAGALPATGVRVDRMRTPPSVQPVPRRPLFFRYISEAKVQMLLPQVDPAANDRTDEPLVSRTLRLCAKLEQLGAIKSIEDDPKPNANEFYSSKGIWRSGPFGFSTMVSASVAYFVWKRIGNAVVVLAGSPDNLIGQRLVREGYELSSSGDAVGTLGSGEILRAICTDEIPYVTIGGRGKGPDTARPQRKIQVDRHRWAQRNRARSNEEPYTDSAGGLLAAFCFNRLTTLPETSIETVFRIYSEVSAAGESFLADMEAEYEAGQARYASLYTSDGLRLARQLGLGTLRTVYIGSPVFTAVA